MQAALKNLVSVVLSTCALGLLVHCVGDDPAVGGGSPDAARPGDDGGSSSGGALDADVVPDTGPVPGGPFGRISQIVAGDAFTCALGTSGQVRCWGSNGQGQLGQDRGDASRSEVSAEATIVFDTTQKVVELAAAFETVCARFEDLTVRCWGGNSRGERGAGGPSAQTGRTPGDMASIRPVELGNGRAAARIYAGTSHFCTIVHNSGEVLCWGMGKDGARYGWLGNDLAENIGDQNGEMGAALQAIPSLGKTVGLALGYTSTCALDDQGNVRCFGTARGGQLGNGEADGAVDVHDMSTITVTASGVTTLFGRGPAYAVLGADATVSTWGDGRNGWQGLGDVDNRLAPTPLPVPSSGAVRAIVSGSSHRCLLLANGDLSCVGDGSFGKLGYGDTAPRGNASDTALAQLAPTRTGVALVATGGDHTCAVTTDDAVVCWGLNSHGQLGPAAVGNELGGAPTTTAANLPTFRIE